MPETRRLERVTLTATSTCLILFAESLLFYPLEYWKTFKRQVILAHSVSFENCGWKGHINFAYDYLRAVILVGFPWHTFSFVIFFWDHVYVWECVCVSKWLWPQGSLWFIGSSISSAGLVSEPVCSGIPVKPFFPWQRQPTRQGLRGNTVFVARMKQ